jgi:magnesium-protoporphyrin O-methyltransferase
MLRAYRRHGPARSTRILLDAIRATGVEGRTLLDIGGGVGVLQHELLDAGLASAVSVEASQAATEACRAEAERRGHAHRIEHHLGDVRAVGPTLRPADIVTLDRVVCCGPDMETVIERSAALAREVLGVVLPRDVGWVKLGWRLPSNLKQRAIGSPLRLYVHATRDVELAVARVADLRPHLAGTAGVWQVVVFTRD